MSDIAIRVQNLSKLYKIGALKQRHDTVRDHLAEGFKWLFNCNSRRPSLPSTLTSQPSDTLWALKDISFDIRQGDIVGIIGRNGAGKSTLLKILAQITEPTEGRAEIYGRIGSLLEVGTGFHPELTGRENIFLNGAILGMRRTEINRKFDEIVAFAEVEKFIDTPVKHYSSGMYLRLAFAVAAHLDPEILIVDEVLAVGDAVFQRKCLGKMEEVAVTGRTVLFVSHNMAAVIRLCKWGLWLDGGRTQAYANVENIVTRYLASGVQEGGEVTFLENPQSPPESEYVRLSAVRVRNSQGHISASLDTRMPFTIEIDYQILRRVSNLRVGFTLTASDGVVVLSSNDMDSGPGELEREPGTYVNECTIPGDFLNYGQYFISVGADFPMIQTHFFVDRLLAFHVEQTGGVAGSISDGRAGFLRLRLPWNIQKCGTSNGSLVNR